MPSDTPKDSNDPADADLQETSYTGSNEREEQTVFLSLYDIIDGWYHRQTRRHLVDIDPNAKNMLDDVVKLHNRLIESAERAAYNQAIEDSIQAVGDNITPVEIPHGSPYISGVNEARNGVRDRLDALRKQGGGE